MPNATRTFWTCFERALSNNKRTYDGNHQILSIIAEDFTYDELQNNLGVGRHTISEARKHGRINGYGAPITKRALWERFSEQYPNGMRRTSFMTKLKGGHFVYQENLGGLCSTCNENGYLVFSDINTLIAAHITDESTRKHLLEKSQNLRHYIHHQYCKSLTITTDGMALHDTCISHCIRHAFGDCNIDHPNTCSNCENLFSFFEQLKEQLGPEFNDTLVNYQEKLISWMGHHACKTYLNIYVRTNLEELDADGAVLIVDYKMKILPTSSRETKKDFFDDTHQDAWFTASSIHLENLEPKPKWISILSDNGMHYHCTELMLIIGHLKEWYDVIPRRWLFLEAVEAKTAIDSHHAQIAQAIKRYIKLGFEVENGEDIENAIRDIAGTHVANLNPDRNTDKEKLGTITGISNFQEWTWPQEDEKNGYIYMLVLYQPDPSYTQHTEPSKLWTMPIVDKPVCINIPYNIDMNNQGGVNHEPVQYSSQSHRFFFSGWALKENEKTKSREPAKRMTAEVKRLLEIMFHTGTANPRQKMNAQQMHEELLQRVHQVEFIFINRSVSSHGNIRFIN
ncbi:uncharacterized protein OCT59_016087 [Rhizophagus irregularis]|uniref:uncharacterized protein n=1 Tax=Rhizophagus irregularis TaxID=588596 RepID=UPI003323B00A|nr:hypothetical protein OCT59_016087 [Rhizophagus irregularis]